MISTLLRATTQLVFPPRCGACDAWLPHADTTLCPECLLAVVENDGPRCARCDAPGPSPGLCARCKKSPPSFHSVRAPYIYGGPIAELITRAKYGKREDLAVALGRMLAKGLARDEYQNVTAIVPMPLGRRRLRQRGYNQALLIAREVQRSMGLPLAHLLVRVRETEPQTGLARARRLENVRGAFLATRALHGDVLLVDDAVTTATTMREAAAALRQAGTERVLGVAVARSEELE